MSGPVGETEMGEQDLAIELQDIKSLPELLQCLESHYSHTSLDERNASPKENLRRLKVVTSNAFKIVLGAESTNWPFPSDLSQNSEIAIICSCVRLLVDKGNYE